jgi:DNA-binding cell septation regulator SpoVG
MSNKEVFSDWKVFPLKNQVGNLVANGKVTILGTVEVSFTIVKGNKGLFAGLPSKQSEKNGEKVYYPDVKILDKTTYADFQTQALAAYEARLAAPPVNVTSENTKGTPF